MNPPDGRAEALAVYEAGKAPDFDHEQGLSRLMARTAGTLHEADPSFPEALPRGAEARIVDGFIGPGYGSFTREGVEAARLAAGAGYYLEGTYSGKTLAALARQGRAGGGARRTVLFWLTANSRDLTPRVAGLDFSALPKSVHRYFTHLVQPLDR